MSRSSVAKKIADKIAEAGKKVGPALGLVDDEIVDPVRAKQIAKAYDNMQHAPDSPEVVKAYDALISETTDQFKDLQSKGYKFTKIKPGMENPYKKSADMFKDIEDNKHLYYYPTEQGFGSGAETVSHPMLKKASEKLNGEEVVANDIFRIVHDMNGHSTSKNKFGAKGEEGAWRDHMKMYSPEAQKALTTETRGQNSWVNFGPEGEFNRANPAKTKYADQKAGILPEWARSTAKEDGVPVVHYGKPGLEEIDPKFAGSGADDTKFLRAGKPETKTSSFYDFNDKSPEDLVLTKSGKEKYSGRIKGSLYDFSKDPEKYLEKAQAQLAAGTYNGKAVDAKDLAKEMAKNAGHSGLSWEMEPGKKIYESFSPVKVRPSYAMAGATAAGVGAATLGGNNDAEAGSKNVRLQKALLFGKSSQPAAGTMERGFQTAMLEEWARKNLGMDIVPSGGKIDVKTGARRSEDALEGVDKPDWRSGNLEAQWNPDAITHELAHTSLLPEGVGLKDGQTYMDKQYSDIQKQYGYMKQKRSQGEVQPMAAENLIRRQVGLPANASSVPVKAGEGPRLSVEDPNVVIGTRVKKGDKEVDLIRQSRFLSPENKQRMQDIADGKIIFDKEKGWIPNMNRMGAKVEAHKAKKAVESIEAPELGSLSKAGLLPGASARPSIGLGGAASQLKTAYDKIMVPVDNIRTRVLQKIAEATDVSGGKDQISKPIREGILNLAAPDVTDAIPMAKMGKIMGAAAPMVSSLIKKEGSVLGSANKVIGAADNTAEALAKAENKGFGKLVVKDTEPAMKSGTLQLNTGRKDNILRRLLPSKPGSGI